MAAIIIDSPRWRDGWGEPLSQPSPQPALRVVDGTGTRRPDLAVYRRRRRAVLAVAALVAVAVLAVGIALVNRVGAAGAVPEGRQVHVVQPGDTYWSIAAATTDGGARTLFPGDRVELP
jgi:hypothetical protein